MRFQSPQTKKELKRALLKWERMVNEICKLANEAPLTIVNDVDDEPPPGDFRLANVIFILLLISAIHKIIFILDTTSNVTC